MSEKWGLVLGGGGVLGAAWMTGALVALAETHGLDPRDADLIVGTSAGSVTSALIGAGASVEELHRRQLDEPVTTGPLANVEWDAEHGTGGSAPPAPRFSAGPSSPNLLSGNLNRLRRLPPTAVLAALLPEGRGSIDAVGGLVRAVVPSGWTPHPGVRAVAMHLDSGRRTAFGAPTAPVADIADAVMASCAIPGWYAPVTVAGERYVDGGACSATNVDLTAGHGLARVFVLAPMVSFAMDTPRHWRTRAERGWRARVTRRCLREVAKVHLDGAEVTVVGPGPEDLEAIGSNLMAVERRHAVLRTSLQTSARALADPEPLEHLPPPLQPRDQDVAASPAGLGEAG
jgi:NTE family protein